MRSFWTLAVLYAALPAAFGYFRGDPVQAFKRIQFEGKRTVWSDVLVGQAPLFAVDKAVELHIPSQDISPNEPLKLQLSFDNERFEGEWITLSDGAKHQKGKTLTHGWRGYWGEGETQLDVLNVIFVYSGSDIHEVHYRQRFRKLSPQERPSSHQEHVTIAYHWVQEIETDTRSGLNFLFVAGCFLTILAILAVAGDSTDLASDRAILIPEYAETDRRKPKVDAEGGGIPLSSASSALRHRAGPESGVGAGEGRPAAAEDVQAGGGEAGGGGVRKAE